MMEETVPMANEAPLVPTVRPGLLVQLVLTVPTVPVDPMVSLVSTALPALAETAALEVAPALLARRVHPAQLELQVLPAGTAHSVRKAPAVLPALAALTDDLVCEARLAQLALPVLVVPLVSLEALVPPESQERWENPEKKAASADPAAVVPKV